MAGFERYTPKTQDIMFNLTQIEAKELGHNFIGTEHLLLSILKHKDNIAAQALDALGVTYDFVKENVIEIGEKLDPIEADYRLPYSVRMKSVAEFAVLEANMMSQKYIGPEHLLLGMLKEGEGIGAKVLNKAGLNFQYVKKMIVNILSKNPAAAEFQTEQKQEGAPPQKQGKMIEKYGKDLTQMAQENLLDPVVGREKEIDRVIQILSRRTKNNPCLIGEPGVGKTAIAEGLALRIVEGNVPETVKHKKVVTLDLSGMIAGTKYRGEFEERLKDTVDEIKRNKDVILFIDELHTIIGAGAAEGAMDAANILKPSLARGEIQAIGATTLDEYRKYIEKDAALERRFQPVKVEETNRRRSDQNINGSQR